MIMIAGEIDQYIFLKKVEIISYYNNHSYNK